MQRTVAAILLAGGLLGAAHFALLPFTNEMPGGRTPGYLDANSADYNVVLDSSAFHHSVNPQLIILGGSVSRDGIRPENLKHYYPGYDVHNAAIGGGPNFTELNRIASHLILEVDPSVARQSVVVIGVMFMLYASNELRYPSHTPSYVQQYESRMPLFWSSIISDDLRRHMKDFVRPYYALELWIKDAVHALQAKWASAIGTTFVAGSSLPPPDTPARQNEVRGKLAKYMGSGNKVEALTEQSAELERLVKRLREAGFRVVLYDMPIAQWLRNDFLPYQLYWHHNVPEMHRLARLDSAVFFASCADNYFDSDFSDGLHAIIRPERNQRWAKNLADCMQPWLNKKAAIN